MLCIKSSSFRDALSLLGGNFLLFPCVHPHACKYELFKYFLRIKHCSCTFHETHKQGSNTVGSYVCVKELFHYFQHSSTSSCIIISMSICLSSKILIESYMFPNERYYKCFPNIQNFKSHHLQNISYVLQDNYIQGIWD